MCLYSQIKDGEFFVFFLFFLSLGLHLNEAQKCVNLSHQTHLLHTVASLDQDTNPVTLAFLL